MDLQTRHVNINPTYGSGSQVIPMLDIINSISAIALSHKTSLSSFSGVALVLPGVGITCIWVHLEADDDPYSTCGDNLCLQL